MELANNVAANRNSDAGYIYFPVYFTEFLLCFLKGVAVSHSSTQTIAKDEQLSSKGPTVRRLSRSNSSSGAESKPPSLKRGPSVTRRDISVERTKAPFKVGTATTRRVS